MADDDVSLEDLIAIERVARKLWEQATKGPRSGKRCLSSPSVAQPRPDGGHDLAEIGRHSTGDAYSEPAIRRVMLRPFWEPAYLVGHRGMRTA